jgi:CRP/FNR family transcriptional regulator
MYLKQHVLTTGMNEAQILEMCHKTKIKNVRKGESIYLNDSFDNRIYLVLKGKIKVSEFDERGDELIKELLSMDEVFGDVSLDSSIADDEFAEAITDNCVICSFNSNDFKNLMHNNPLLAMNYAAQVSTKLRRLENRHSNLVFKDARARLMSFFKDWAYREGDRTGDKIILNNYLTHNDIAGIISTSRQSVTTLLNELRDNGLLFYNRKRIEITAPYINN